MSERLVDSITDALQPVRRAALGLGSNLGDAAETLQGAVDVLLATPGVHPVALSPVYRTDPVGGPEQSVYLNAVLVVDTTLSARTLLERAHAVEDAFGRVREERWGPRTLDVDVLVLGDLVERGDALILPHPRAHERAFVLVPWADADPAAVLPGYGRVADLAAAVDRRGVALAPDVVVTLPPAGLSSAGPAPEEPSSPERPA